MPTEGEVNCCHSYSIVLDLLDGSAKECITEHEGFLGNCLNRYVLEASLYEYVLKTGILEEYEPVNE